MVATTSITDDGQVVRSNWLNSYFKKKAGRKKVSLPQGERISRRDLGRIAEAGKVRYRRSLVLISFFYH